MRDEITNQWEEFKSRIDKQIKELDVRGHLWISSIDCDSEYGNVTVEERDEEDNVSIHIW